MKVDIIITLWNQLQYTQNCIQSILVNTSVPFHLILIDNASTDNTPQFLEFLHRHGGQTTVIFNKENLGWSKGLNQGIKASKAEYLCFLNNDTILTKHWLNSMLSAFYTFKDVGAVVPVSDKTSGRQNILYNNGKDTWEEAIYFTGLCILMPRDVIDEIGLFDERFGLGGQADLDYAIRIRKAGYKIIIARNVFIKHFGRISIRHLPEYKTGEFQKENFQKLTKLREKWGDSEIDLLWNWIDKKYDPEEFKKEAERLGIDR